MGVFPFFPNNSIIAAVFRKAFLSVYSFAFSPAAATAVAFQCESSEHSYVSSVLYAPAAAADLLLLLIRS